MNISNFRLEPASLSFFLRLGVAVVALNLFVALMAGVSIQQARHHYQERAEVTTQNLAQVLENDIAGDFHNIDIALFAVLDEYQRQLATGRVDESALNNHIERVRGRLPDIDALRIADAQGVLIYGSGVDKTAHTSLADRPHFQLLRADPKAGLVFSQPQISRVNKKWVVVLARRVDLPNGEFGGMVFAAISLDHLTQMFASLNVGENGIVTLRGADMGIVIRHPEPQGGHSVVGQKSAPQTLRDMIGAGKREGSYLSLSPIDGMERTFTFRKVADYPYYIIVGLSSNDYLSEWRKETARLGALVTVFFVITLAASWLIYRNWIRRRDSLAALARQEAKFRTVADYTYDWEYWQGAAHEILYMTPSCERVTGYAAAEFVADPGLLLRIVHPLDRHVLEHHLDHVAEREAALQDFRIVRRDGEIRWISHHCYGIAGEDGQAMGRRISNRDITERKQAEIALREEKAFSETLIDALPGVFYRLDEQARLVNWNGNLAALVGPDGLEKAKRNVLEVIHEADRDLLAQKIRAGFENGYVDAEARVMLSDGTPRDFYFIGRTLNIGGQVYLLGSGVDISIRKAAEAALSEMNTTLEHRVADTVRKSMEHERLLIQQSRLAAMGEMIGNIAHQWRQPLNALALLQANIKDAFDYGDLDRENMARFNEDGQRLIQKMSSTIDDFRDFFRPNREKIEFPLHEAIADALKIIGASFHNHNIEIVFPATEEIRVIGYPNEFSQVLLNVLNNAKEAMRERCVHGGVIDILAERDGATIRVMVRDNGGGIPEGVLPRIFEPYYTTKEKGTGIGLYMSRMIMEHMNGAIEARNVGEGAEFKLTLPCAPNPAPENQGAQG